MAFCETCAGNGYTWDNSFCVCPTGQAMAEASLTATDAWREEATRLYKPAQAARLLTNARTGQPGISTQRATLLCKLGRLGQRVGGGWVISAAEIKQFNAGRVE